MKKIGRANGSLKKGVDLCREKSVRLGIYCTRNKLQLTPMERMKQSRGNGYLTNMVE